ncbi:MAG: cobalamin-dependent protein [Bacteroidales bacterium]|nr:cobalamin-dependent protein [Bacteroidales bacterium]
MMQQAVRPLIDEHVVNIIGGCCGTEDTHIREIAKLVKKDDGQWVSPHEPGKKAEASQPAAADKPAQASAQPAQAAAQAAPRATPIGKPAAQAFDPTAEDALFTAVLKGKLPEAQAATKVALEAGIEPQAIINGQMIRAMGEIGQQFQNGKVFVPQLLMAARAMKGAMQLLQPLMAGQKLNSLGKIVIGTVKGDLHDIGKNLVASMLEGCGFEVVDIGIDVPKEKYVEAVKEHHADILAISALLTTTMDYIPEVIQAVEEAGLRDKVKIMVGGAPLSQEFADQVGADGYSDNANSAVALAKQLMGK